MTRLVSESQTDPSNAHARAQLQLNRFTGTRDAVTLSTAEFDLKGDVSVGDYLWVYDPDTHLIDSTNEVIFRGVRMNPMRLRLFEMTWPVTSNHSVAYRDWTGKWYDLTQYVVAESGDTTLVVGGYNRSLTSGSSSDGGVGGSRPQPNTTVPGVPTWMTPFPMSVYQSPVNGETKAQVQLHWTRPDNTDGTTITDGDHYEIRYRNASTPLFPVRWGDLAGYRWGDLKAAGATWANPIQYPTGPWNYASAPWTELAYLLQELAPSMPYEVQIRAVDGATPSNYGDWSTVEAFQTYGDTYPPATPAPPEIASSLIAVQVTHRLGRSDGGEYNLDLDLHHLEVHGEYEPNFQPSDSTRLGNLPANAGMITGEIPAVATFQIESTKPVYFKVIAVDIAGNKSSASSAVSATAQLIDDAHISNLTVSKVTAGTITSDWIVSANVATGLSGARAGMNSQGFYAYDGSGNPSFKVDSGTGNVYSLGNLVLDGNIEMPGAVRVKDSLGALQAELGLLTDGSYGIALRRNDGAYMKLSDFVFGPQSNFVDGAVEQAFSPTPSDIATYGPAVTVYIGPTRRAMVFLASYVVVGDAFGTMNYQVSGASSIIYTSGVGAGSTTDQGNQQAQTTYIDFLDASNGLNQGYNTFTAKYARDSGPLAGFRARRIAVLPF